MSRTFTVTIPSIASEERLSEADLLADFEGAHLLRPMALGQGGQGGQGKDQGADRPDSGGTTGGRDRGGGERVPAGLERVLRPGALHLPTMAQTNPRLGTQGP